MRRFKKIYIEITNICNLSCPFCPPTNRKKEIMKYDDFKTILHKIKPYTDYIYLHVKGEPLLHPDFDKILSLCGQLNIKINLVTNGRLIKKQQALLLSSKSIRQINFSMHSINNEDLATISDIINFTKVALSKTNTIISYRFWNQNAININDNIFSIIRKSFNIDERLYNDIQYKQSIKILSNFYINKDDQFEWPALTNNKSDSQGFCYGLKDQLAILVDGTVVPCCLDSEGIVNLGNILKEDLELILNKDRTKKIIAGFRNNKIVEELCQKCSYRDRFK